MQKKIIKYSHYIYNSNIPLYLIFTLIVTSSPHCKSQIPTTIGKSNTKNNKEYNIKTCTSTSPYSISIAQPDGTSLLIIGKGDMNEPYTETIDGYTILRNEDLVYEYAIIGKDGRLKPGGIKAKNEENRSKKEKRYLLSLEKHLRNK
jgi:hypothetical protein